MIEVDLLSDLNEIYAGDSEFLGIICQENDDTKKWEIFLREKGKGDIRLSESGSSLQSVFIILSYLRLVPKLENIDWSHLILAIEEPENNLHPALLRRLLNFLASSREKFKFSLIFTTHSPICIDWSTRRPDANIIHVRREGDQSKCNNVFDYTDKSKILRDLDIKGSDILQSNGIIWVEGPSDRIYIKRWLDLYSNGSLIEGAHYTFMLYGGKILSHFDSLPPSDLPNKIQMLSVNRNVAVVIDSDRKPTVGRTKTGRIRKPRMNLNKTKTEIIGQIETGGSFAWVTEGKEIENYVSDRVWSKVLGISIRTENEYMDIPNIPKIREKYTNKVDLARAAEPHIGSTDIRTRLDLEDRLKILVDHIKNWNSL